MRAADVAGQVTNSVATAAKKQVSTSVSKALQDAILGKDKTVKEVLNEGSGNSLNKVIAGVNDAFKIKLSSKRKNFIVPVVEAYNQFFGAYLAEPELHALNFFKLEMQPQWWPLRKLRGYRISSICVARPLEQTSEIIYNETDQKMTSLFRAIQKKDKSLNNSKKVSNPLTLVSLMVPRINEIVIQTDGSLQSELYDRLSGFIRASVEIIDQWYWKNYYRTNNDIQLIVAQLSSLAQEISDIAQLETQIPSLIEPTAELTERVATITSSLEHLLRDFLPYPEDPSSLDFNLRSKSIEWLLEYSGKVNNMLDYSKWNPDLGVKMVNEADFKKVINLHDGVNKVAQLYEELITTHRAGQDLDHCLQKVAISRVELLENIEQKLIYQRELMASMGVDGHFDPFCTKAIIQQVRKSNVYAYKSKEDQKIYEKDVEEAHIPDAVYYLKQTVFFYREFYYATLASKTNKYFVKECHYGAFTKEVQDLTNYFHKAFESLKMYAMEIQRFSARPMMDLLDEKIRGKYERRSEKMQSHACEILEMLNGCDAIYSENEEGGRRLVKKGVRGAVDCLNEITHQIADCSVISDGEAMSRGQKFLRITMDILASHCHDNALNNEHTLHSLERDDPAVIAKLKQSSRLSHLYGSMSIREYKIENRISIRNIMRQSAMNVRKGLDRSNTLEVEESIFQSVNAKPDFSSSPKTANHIEDLSVALLTELNGYTPMLQQSLNDYIKYSIRERSFGGLLTGRHSDRTIEKSKKKIQKILGMISMSIDKISSNPQMGMICANVLFQTLYESVKKSQADRGHHSIYFYIEKAMNKSMQEKGEASVYRRYLTGVSELSSEANAVDMLSDIKPENISTTHETDSDSTLGPEIAASSDIETVSSSGSDCSDASDTVMSGANTNRTHQNDVHSDLEEKHDDPDAYFAESAYSKKVADDSPVESKDQKAKKTRQSHRGRNHFSRRKSTVGGGAREALEYASADASLFSGENRKNKRSQRRRARDRYNLRNRYRKDDQSEDSIHSKRDDNEEVRVVAHTPHSSMREEMLSNHRRKESTIHSYRDENILSTTMNHLKRKVMNSDSAFTETRPRGHQKKVSMPYSPAPMSVSSRI